ncbi:hypothetical protein PINS_up013834 [Pythium insidiosum]|nr:hypothetical protein PINS_up013834 [Pythium insidiosum]
MRWALATLSCSSSLQLSFEIVVALMLLAADIGDLWFKTRWMGPDYTYSFLVWSIQDRQRTPLVPLFNLTDARSNPASVPHRHSGWSSFLASCDSIYAIGDVFFHHAIGENCHTGGSNGSIVVPQLVFAASIRADTVAWAACKILRPDRRPTLCRTRLVQRVPTAYRFDERPRRVAYATRHVDDVEPLSDWDTRWDDTEDKWTLEPSSAGESEVLELLSVIAESTPIGRVVCVEGFAYEGPGRYATSIFGCGSPSAFRAAFAGVHAPELALFQQNKAWLTSDWLNVLGMEFLIRENCIELFRVEDDGARLTLENHTKVNFSCFGGLYVVMIAIDSALAVLNVVNIVTSYARFVGPWWRQCRVVRPLTPESESLNGDVMTNVSGVMTSSLWRSAFVVPLLLASQVVSWMTVLANAIIWTWTEDPRGWIQAYLSTLRFWILGVITCHALWNALVVVITERRAFAIARRTRIATYEVLMVAAIVTYVRRLHLFGIGGQKYVMDGQRVEDADAFEGHIAFANTIPESQFDQQVTQPNLLWLVYRPLVEIVSWSLLGCIAVVVTRFIFFARRRHKVELVPVLNTNQCERPAEEGQYKRCVIEDTLGVPIRARSLVRSSHAMEVTHLRHSSERHLRLALLFDHGIQVDGGRMRARIGFPATLGDVLPVGDHRYEGSRGFIQPLR